MRRQKDADVAICNFAEDKWKDKYKYKDRVKDKDIAYEMCNLDRGLIIFSQKIRLDPTNLIGGQTICDCICLCIVLAAFVLTTIFKSYLCFLPWWVSEEVKYVCDCICD